MPQFEGIDLQIRDCVAWITLNHPETLNALTAAIGRELQVAIDQLAVDPAVRCVILTGAGRGFCAGADLEQLVALEPDGVPDLRTPLREIFHPLILSLRKLHKPVVAAVNGAAVGFGCSLALAADIVVAAESAYFLLAFANVGLTIDGGASALLVGRIGHGRASALSLLGDRVSAAQALDWGLANRVVADDALLDDAHELGRRLSTGSPGSYAAIKRTLNAAAYPRLEEILDLEAELQQKRAGSADFAEGVRAFLEKRSAKFTGE
jgi:2-(1,2-epoxy-1,2-dihydrophenyl)acetyl-CoA isomerase